MGALWWYSRPLNVMHYRVGEGDGDRDHVGGDRGGGGDIEVTGTVCIGNGHCVLAGTTHGSVLAWHALSRSLVAVVSHHGGTHIE